MGIFQVPFPTGNSHHIIVQQNNRARSIIVVIPFQKYPLFFDTISISKQMQYI